MLRAGTAAAACLLRDHGDRLARGVALFAGPGNNGGDAYIVAAQLARAGIAVRLHATGAPRTEDARRAAALAAPSLRFGTPTGSEELVVDGLLGTGHTGALRDDIASACARMALARDGGATIVALDVPTGLDATTGAIAEGSVAAHRTLVFGTLKRGLLIARAHAGAVALLDIGLARAVDVEDGAWSTFSPASIGRALPSIAWNAHKGSRGRVDLVGGSSGMAGAAVLAARGALAAGAGLVRARVSSRSVATVQGAVPQALAESYDAFSEHAGERDADASERHGGAGERWANALAIGPGLRDDGFRIVEGVLAANPSLPVVFDAGALNAAAFRHLARGARATGVRGDRTAIAATLSGWSEGRRDVVCTPHPGEFARLRGDERADDDWGARADALVSLAINCGCTVLLKGTPTLVATPDGAPPVAIARGTALLATGGSGDLLTGIIGALLAAGASGLVAAVAGATAHGLAAEIATTRARSVRGPSLDAVLAALPEAWSRMGDDDASPYPELLLALPSLALPSLA